jgi:hypothetical protein
MVGDGSLVGPRFVPDHDSWIHESFFFHGGGRLIEPGCRVRISLFLRVRSLDRESA